MSIFMTITLNSLSSRQLTLVSELLSGILYCFFSFVVVVCLEHILYFLHFACLF